MAQPPVVVYNPAHNYLLPPPKQHGHGSYKIQTQNSSGLTEKLISIPNGFPVVQKAGSSTINQDEIEIKKENWISA